MNDIVISSWIVLDDREDATEFPSTGCDSSSLSFQLVYWRCVALFFVTSKIHNPSNRHTLFCNKDIDVVCPADVLKILKNLEVDFVTFPLAHRFPRGTVTRWGNQFYVLDIIKYWANNDNARGFILADSDCIWRKPVDTFVQDIVSNKCLLYTLRPGDQKNYQEGNLLNGMTHRRMRDIVESEFSKELDHMPLYHGGEFFAATKEYCTDIVSDFSHLWQRALSEVQLNDSIKEEAHFLSILAEARDITPYTANHIVRRIWTHFKDLNVQAGDVNLALWHLPAEKKFGFARMYLWYQNVIEDWRDICPNEINIQSAYFMGIPRRSTGKLILDVVQKVGERLGDKLSLAAQ